MGKRPCVHTRVSSERALRIGWRVGDGWGAERGVVSVVDGYEWGLWEDAGARVLMLMVDRDCVSTHGCHGASGVEGALCVCCSRRLEH